MFTERQTDLGADLNLAPLFNIMGIPEDDSALTDDDSKEEV